MKVNIPISVKIECAKGEISNAVGGIQKKRGSRPWMKE